MSYIITTSSQDEYNNTEFGIEKPFSYHNHMTQPVIIPAFGKIAVQSVKINRDPDFVINDKNYVGYIMMGDLYDNPADADLDETQNYVPALFEVEPGEYSTTELASAINRAFSRACQFHPDVADTTTILNYNVDGTFKGFIVTFNQKALPTNDLSLITKPYYPVGQSEPPDVDPLEVSEIVFDEATKEFTGPAWNASPAIPNPNMWAQFLEAPISHQDGTIEFDVSEALRLRLDTSDSEYTPPCAFGLSRPIMCSTERAVDARPYIVNNQAEDVPGNKAGISYFLPADDTGQLGMNEIRDVWDIVINCGWDQGGVQGDSTELSVYAMFNNGVKGQTEGEVAMEEIEYWKGAEQGTRPTDGGGKDKKLDLTLYYEAGKAGVYASAIKTIRITIQNERLKIDYTVAGDATYYVLVNPLETKYRAPSLGMNQWALYPKVMLGAPQQGIDIVADQTPLKLSIQEYKGRKMLAGLSGDSALAYNNGNENSIFRNGCWYNSFNKINAGYFTIPPVGSGVSPTRNVDCKNSQNQTLILAGTEGLPKGTNGGYLNDFHWAPVVGPDTNLDSYGFISNPLPNIKELLGLLNDVYTDADAELTYTVGPPSSAVLKSAQADKLLGGQAVNSLFVRLNNTSQISFNAGKSSISKIVYHIPQFNQQGSSTGALFFEASEKTYINVNNPEPVTINDMRVDIVDQYEKYAKSLRGNTVVCFHIVGPADTIVGKV